MPTTLSKPPGIPVFPFHDTPQADCLLHRLLADEPWREDIDWPSGFAGGIAHRLDVSTSGAVWVAGSLDELQQLRELFSKHVLRKTYRFQTAKIVDWNRNRCDRPIAHDKRRKKRMVVQRGASTPHRGRWYEAHTRFDRLSEHLWQATITTGVMHQIRVHAAFVGLALQGDRFYGGGQPPEHWPEGVLFRLHHVGLKAPDGTTTDPVPLPDWAVS